MSNSNKFSAIIRAQIQEYSTKAFYSEDGKVLNIGDGICQVSGLTNIMLNEIVIFENGAIGIAFNLEANIVGVAVLGEYENISENSIVKRTNNLMSIPVGDGLLGRVINPLGEPIDGFGQIIFDKRMPIEKIAPGVMARKSIDSPFETGILSIDAMFPIGKGQRELIIGDKQTGKTTIAIDSIINQKGKNVKCIYVAIGQKNSTISQFKRILEKNNAMSYTTIVSSSAADLPSIKYWAPFAGITIAEEWMSHGQDVLIVYDDLSKHAIAYRTLSLLLRRPPGREAYPGDVFYLHSRLLERSGKLSDKYGGGSITALPIIETQSGDIAAYIPTNVISITDGQLFTMSSLFNAGQRPAIDAGLSVSRIGSAAQTPIIKKLASSLKLELAQYRELDAFSQFGSDLDKETKDTLVHGRKVMEIIKQGQNKPLSQALEALFLFIIKEKIIKWIPVEYIRNFKDAIEKHFKNLDIYHEIESSKQIDASVINLLKDEFNILIKNFIITIPNYNLEFKGLS